MYEKAAPLRITPTPVSIVRVFMLWRGVGTEQLENWQGAITKAETMNVSEWCEVVGIPTRNAQENDGLRVLEWGGMEVEEY